MIVVQYLVKMVCVPLTVHHQVLTMLLLRVITSFAVSITIIIIIYLLLLLLFISSL